jgi:hypothetical protein
MQQPAIPFFHKPVVCVMVMVILFSYPAEGSDAFHDCSEGGDDVDVFELLDRVLASEGFVPGTP